MVLALYLGSGIRRHPWATARALLLYALLTAGVVFLASVFPAISFRETGAERVAFWNLRLTSEVGTPLTSAQRAALQAQTDYWVVCRRATGSVASEQGRSTTADITLIDSDQLDRAALSWYSPDLLISGRMNVEEAWVDARTAGSLGLRLGDTVTLQVTDSAPSGVRELRYRATVGAIVAPTARTSGVAVATGQGSGMRVPMDVFAIAGPGAEAALSRLFGAPAWESTAIESDRARARSRMDTKIAPAARLSLILLSIAAYAAYGWMEIGGRIRRRRADIAILLSMGASTRSALSILGAEQALIAGLGSLVGASIGLWVLGSPAGVWVPADIRVALGLYALLANSVVIAACTWRASRQLGGLCVAALLGDRPVD